jgi:hypothetical protein
MRKLVTVLVALFLVQCVIAAHLLTEEGGQHPEFHPIPVPSPAPESTAASASSQDGNSGLVTPSSKTTPEVPSASNQSPEPKREAKDEKRPHQKPKS